MKEHAKSISCADETQLEFAMSVLRNKYNMDPDTLEMQPYPVKSGFGWIAYFNSFPATATA